MLTRAAFLVLALGILVAADEPGMGAASQRVAAPVDPRPPPSVAAAARRGSVEKVRVFRFDALRVDGIAGPNALIVHQLQHSRRRTLVMRKRSFLFRMPRAVEVGGQGTP